MNLNRVNQLIQGKFTLLERMVPEEKKRKIDEQLKHMEIDSTRYINLSLGISITISSLLTGFTVTSDPLKGIGMGLISFSLLYLLSTRLPKVMKRKYDNSLEKSMAKTLRTISTELSVKSSFQSCIENAANQDTPAGEEFKIIKRDVERGASLPEALSRMSERNSSRFIKRTASQMASAYSSGPLEGAKALRKLAEEQEAVLRRKVEEYNQKLLVYSLVFIATSAVVPAMFQALVIVGSNFLKLSINPLQAFLIPAVVFPSLNLGIFLYITSKKP